MTDEERQECQAAALVIEIHGHVLEDLFSSYDGQEDLRRIINTTLQDLDDRVAGIADVMMGEPTREAAIRNAARNLKLAPIHMRNALPSSGRKD